MKKFFSIQSLFGSHKGTTSRRRHNRASGARKSSFTPRFEGLEDRAMLSAISVTNTDDSGPGSLRQAIADANTTVAEDVISFAEGVSGTITLTSGELSIFNDLIIDGPSSGEVTISGNDASRVFFIETDTDVAIDDVTVTDGRAFGIGGGIFHTGNELTLTRVNVSGNQVVGTADEAAGGGAHCHTNDQPAAVTIGTRPLLGSGRSG